MRPRYRQLIRTPGVELDRFGGRYGPRKTDSVPETRRRRSEREDPLVPVHAGAAGRPRFIQKRGVLERSRRNVVADDGAEPRDRHCRPGACPSRVAGTEFRHSGVSV
jgi:hypothetical protein